MFYCFPLVLPSCPFSKRNLFLLGGTQQSHMCVDEIDLLWKKLINIVLNLIVSTLCLLLVIPLFLYIFEI